MNAKMPYKKVSFSLFTNLSSSKVGHDKNLTFIFTSKTVFLKNLGTLTILPLLSDQGTDIYFHFLKIQLFINSA